MSIGGFSFSILYYKKKRGQLARLVLGLYDTPLWLRRRMRWGPIVKSRS